MLRPGREGLHGAPMKSFPSDHEPVNCGVQRWTIHAPCSNQYEKDDEGNWVEWDDVTALLWERDEARTEADTLRARIERAVTWLVTVRSDQPASIIADRAKLALEALRGKE